MCLYATKGRFDIARLFVFGLYDILSRVKMLFIATKLTSIPIRILFKTAALNLYVSLEYKSKDKKKVILLSLFIAISVTFKAQYVPLINESNSLRGTMYGLITTTFWQKHDGNEQVGDMFCARVSSGPDYNTMDYQLGLVREDVG